MILVLWKTRILILWKRRILVLWKTRILVLWKRRILVLWKTRIREFSFYGKAESENFFLLFFFNQEFSFYGKRELEHSSSGGKRDPVNSRFVENANSEICGKREFSFCGKPESENFFFFLSENSRFVENGNWRIFVLLKT